MSRCSVFFSIIALASVAALVLGPAPAFAGTNSAGFFDEYLVAGGYNNPGGGAPGLDVLGSDFLCDGVHSESSILPADGLVLSPPVTNADDCGGLKPPSLQPFHPNNIDPTQVIVQPALVGGHAVDSLTFSALFGPDNVMAYSWVYVENLTPSALDVELQLASDDGIAVDVNRAPVFALNQGGGGGGAGVIQDIIPITLAPGHNLLQFKVFQGGGGWNMRARLYDPATCLPLLDGDGRVIIGVEAPASIAPPALQAVRSISTTGTPPELVTAQVDIDVTSTDSFSLVETFDSGWTVSNVSPPATVSVFGRLEWHNLAASTDISYRLSRSGGFVVNDAVITGEVNAQFPVIGDSQIPGGGYPYIHEWLVAPPLDLGGGNPCNLSENQYNSATWYVEPGDPPAVNDRTIVPEEGLEVLVDHSTLDRRGNSQSWGWPTLSDQANVQYYNGDPAVPTTPGIINVVPANANGEVRPQNAAVYGVDIDQVMNTAWFYVDGGQNGFRAIFNVRTDDGAQVRLNGHHVWANPVCRGLGNWTNRDRIYLDVGPGKNLISVSTFDNTGNYGWAARFEDANGFPLPIITTLDPTGYNQAGHDTPTYPAEVAPPPGPGALEPHPDYVSMVLLTAANRQDGAVNDGAGPSGCVYIPATLEGPWIVGQDSNLNPFTDATIVPFAGMEIAIDYTTSQSQGLKDTMSANGKARFWTVPGDVTTSLQIINAVGVTGTNNFDYQNGAIYAGGIDDSMNVAYFYVDNDTGAPIDTVICYGTDDASRLDVNGEVVLTHRNCSGVAPFTNRNQTNPDHARIVPVRLFPGKNQVALYVWERGGGWGMRARFEDGNANADPTVNMMVTLDPTGYTPGMHPPQPLPPEYHVSEVLMTAPLDIPGAGFPDTEPYDACHMDDATLAGPWLVGTTGAGAFNDASLVPAEGASLSVDFAPGASQALGLEAGISAEAQNTFWTVPGDAAASDALIAKVALGADLADLQAAEIFGADIDHAMTAAYFYVVNNSASAECVQIGYFANNAAVCRVNGRPVGVDAKCFAIGAGLAYSAKALAQLDPGKNLIGVYALEGVDGYSLSIRLEDPATGNALTVEGDAVTGARTITELGYDLELTLDSSGYNPAGHADPAPSCTSEPVREFAPYIRTGPAAGFVTEYLVNQIVMDQPHGANLPLPDNLASDFMSADGAEVSRDNAVEGLLVEPGISGLITTAVRGNTCGFTDLVKYSSVTHPSGDPGDPGLFDGERFYGGAPDNYSSSLFFFVENKTQSPLEVWFAFSSDDAAAMYLNGQLIAEHLSGRGYGGRNSLQTGPSSPATLEPGSNLVQLSYIEGGGGSGARAAFYKDSCHTETFSEAEVEVSANPQGFSEPTVRATRSIGGIDCEGNGTVTITISVAGGGSQNVALAEQLPPNVMGSNPSRGQFNPSGDILSFSGPLSDGDTITYDVSGVLPGDSYCLSTVNGILISGDTAFQETSDVCGFTGELYINCGGTEYTDGLGRIWETDTVALPSKYLTSGNDNNANWDVLDPPLGPGINLTADPDIAGKLFDGSIPLGETGNGLWNFERWSANGVEYTFTGLPPGRYEVILCFMEGDCCSPGCLQLADPVQDPCDETIDLSDPAVHSGGCRVFDIEVNGLTVEGFSQVVRASCLAQTPLAAPNSYFIGVTQVFEVTAKNIQVRINDLGGGNPPENASIKGIAIQQISDVADEICDNQVDDNQNGLVDCEDPLCFLESDCESVPPEDCDNGADDDGDTLVDCNDPDCCVEAVCEDNPVCQEGPLLVRGDSDSNGTVELTDGLKTLIALYQGGELPECMDAADADDNGTVELTDAVITFLYLFSGGDAPAPPSPSRAEAYPPEDCGPDTTPDIQIPPIPNDDLGCLETAATCTP